MSKLISLTRGLHSIVDQDKFEYLSQWKWIANDCGRGLPYAGRRIRVAEDRDNAGKFVRMHRMLMGAISPDQIVDHINGNTLDNRICNLRVVTKYQNSLNSRSHGGSSIFKGVSYVSDKKLWVANINVNGKRIYVKKGKDEIDVAKAYDEAAIKYHGEFARLNFPRSSDD